MIDSRLTKVFKLLRKQGFLARQNVADCMSCSLSVLQNWVDSHPTKNYSGLVYYHRQDMEDPQSQIFLRYSNVERSGANFSQDERDKQTVKVGTQVCAALNEMGLRYRWDGSPHTAILVRFVDGDFE